MSAHSPVDVVVLGAGAAGLAAAAQLARAGCSVALLEARKRIGGRILTVHAPGLAVPLELGAEFMHGRGVASFALARRAGIAPVDTAGNRWALREGRLAPRETLFGQVQALLRRADALGEQDLSFDEFLARHAQDPSTAAACTYARALVEGFDAADPARASVRAIAREWSGEGLSSGQYRPAGGYAGLLAQLLNEAEQGRTTLRLETPVQAIDWSADPVRITAQAPAGTFELTARCVLVTLPVSLLQLPPEAAGAVRFRPALDEKQHALRGLAIGPVVKLILRFERAFWEELDGEEYAEAGFLHASDAAFPTFWTALPYRVPLLTGWVGGPRAAKLAASERSQLLAKALDAVQQLFGPKAPVREQLLSYHMHDWVNDPYSRGAYSYVTVGGMRAPEILAEPLRHRLYFAGEATCPGEAGTVEAALESGQRAARQILDRLGARGA